MWQRLITPSLSPLICLISTVFLSCVAVWVFTETCQEQIKILNEEIKQLKEKE